MKYLKICYIGGGSKAWARVLMTDIALAEHLTGEIALYDIDIEAANRNKKIGALLNEAPNCLSKWDYVVYEKLEDALIGSDFVLISILPGTFKEMYSDVHAPEKYGIYQSVGDTVGPGGILRSMRTAPIYEGFAKAIEKCCPLAWVINLTNPMSVCTKTLFDVFPKIKAFGCCHEVFHAQEFLCRVLEFEAGIKGLTRSDIYTDASGVNHFTWITEARYKDIDILKLLPSFMDKYYESGYYEKEGPHFDVWKTDPFAYGNKVKMDMFKRFGALGAAGDRHLVEFMNNKWYIGSKKDPDKWCYALTTVDYRVKQQQERIAETIGMANGTIPVVLQKSDEELVELMKALLGFNSKISNCNIPNQGQVPGLPLGSIVETNCIFTNNCLKPIVSKPLPTEVLNMVYRNCVNIDATYEGIKERNLDKIFAAFVNQPLCSSLSLEDAKDLFKEMISNTKEYLSPYFDLDEYLK